MPSLDNHPSSKYSRLIYIGDSGTGKTSSLISLVKGGYNLRILDLDNGLDSLTHFVMQECPERASQVSYMSFRDKYKMTAAGPVVSGQPRAFIDSLKAMEKWEDGSNPAEWGEGTVFVIDSFSSLGKAAFEWARAMSPTAKDPRQWYFTAQGAIENTIAALTSEAFATNVIIISHVNYREVQEGVVKGYANAIGSALGPIIPKYFNTLVLAETSGSGKNVRRRIRTTPTGIIDLKIANPKVESELPLESGLLTIFNSLQGKSK